MKKAKHKLYSGHGPLLEQSPSEEDFRNDGRNETTRKSRLKVGCSVTSSPTNGRKEKEGRLLSKSSVKRKPLHCSSLSSQRGMKNDGDAASEVMQKSKSGRFGSTSKNGTESVNMRKKKQGDNNVESTQTLQGNLLESEASDYDFSPLYKVASSQSSHSCRHISIDSGSSGYSIDEDWLRGADKDVDLKDVESTEAASKVSEQLQGSQNQPDDVTETLETQKMFITQKDPKQKPKGLSGPLGASRNLRAEGKTQRMRPAKKQHHTVSQVKQLKRGTITQAVMVRHSSCPKQFLISPSSQNKDKSRSRAKLFLRKVKELQEKRKIVADSQISLLEQSLGESQLASIGELSVSPQELGSGTQMFSVSGGGDPDSAVTESHSQSLIPPMVADDDSEEDSDKDTFKEVLAMRLASRKRGRRCKNSGIFGLSPLEEAQEDEISDVVCDERRAEEEKGDKDALVSQSDILDSKMPSEEREPQVNVLRSDEETVKDGNFPECSNQSSLGKKEPDLSQEPAVKQGNVREAKEDIVVGSSETFKVDGSSVAAKSDTRSCKPTDNARHLVEDDATGLLFSTKKRDASGTGGNDQISAAKSAKGNKESTRMRGVIVMETQSERVEPANEEGETETQNDDVTIVPDSHDLRNNSLPGYHFTSDEESSDELHDESVTQAVSNFLSTFEESGDEKAPWQEAEGQVKEDGASKEKKKDNTEKTLKGKGTAQAKDSRQHIASVKDKDPTSSKNLKENSHVFIVEDDGDQQFDDTDKLDEVNLHSGPVTRKKAENTNIKLGDNVVSYTSGVSMEEMKKLSRRLSLSKVRKRLVRVEEDQNTNHLKKGRKLPEGPNMISIRADVHAPGILMEKEEMNEGTGSITSPHKNNSSSANSSQSKNDKEIVCPVEILSVGNGRGSTDNAGDVPTDRSDSSLETCLPEDDDSVGNDAQQRLTSGSSPDEGGELRESKMLVGEVSSSVDTVCKVASSSSPGAGGILESSVKGVAGPPRGECEKCNRLKFTSSSAQTEITLKDLQSQTGESKKCNRWKSSSTTAQTDITLQDLQSQEYFDFCMEFKRLLEEYDKSVITTSGSGSFGSSTSDSESRDNQKAEDLMVLVRRVADSRVRDKTLSSDEVTSDRLKWRKRKRKMVDGSCQIGSPSKGLGMSLRETLPLELSSPKEEPWDSVTDQNIDMEEVGGFNEKYVNACENSPFDLGEDGNSGNESWAAENSLEGKERKEEEGKIKKGKKRKRDGDVENLEETKEKKKNPAAENSLEQRKEILEETTTMEGKKNDDIGKPRRTKKKKKTKRSKKYFSLFDIPVESLPSPDELQRQWKEKRSDAEAIPVSSKRNDFSLSDIPIESLPSPDELKQQRKEKRSDAETLGVSSKRNNFSLSDIPIESLPSPDELKHQGREKRSDAETLGVSSKRNNFSLSDIPIACLPSPDELKHQGKEKRSDAETSVVSSERNNLSLFDIPVESLPSPEELERQGKEKRSDAETLRVDSERNNLSLFDIPVENLPSPEELERQWKEKRSVSSKRNRRKTRKSKRRIKMRKKLKVAKCQEPSSSDFDSTQGVTDLEMELSKKKEKLKKRRKDPEKVKAGQQKLLKSHDDLLDVQGQPERLEDKRESENSSQA